MPSAKEIKQTMIASPGRIREESSGTAAVAESLEDR